MESLSYKTPKQIDYKIFDGNKVDLFPFDCAGDFEWLEKITMINKKRFNHQAAFEDTVKYGKAFWKVRAKTGKLLGAVYAVFYPNINVWMLSGFGDPEHGAKPREMFPLLAEVLQITSSFMIDNITEKLYVFYNKRNRPLARALALCGFQKVYEIQFLNYLIVSQVRRAETSNLFQKS